MSDEPGGGRDAYPGTPRWVKLFVAVTLAIVVVILLVLVAGTVIGLHTPGGPGHMPSPGHSR
jgi:hypothetical protein